MTGAEGCGWGGIVFGGCKSLELILEGFGGLISSKKLYMQDCNAI